MLRNILIKNRLIIAFGLMLFLIFLVAYSGYRGINVTSELSLQMLRTDAQIARYAEDVRTVSLGLRRFEKDYFLNMGNVEKQAEYRAKWDERSRKLTETLDNLDKIVTKEKDKNLVKSMREGFAIYQKAYASVVEQVQDGRVKTPQEANQAISPFKDNIRKLEGDGDEIASTSRKQMEGNDKTLVAYQQQTTYTTLIFIIIALIFGVTISYLLASSIASPVQQIMELFSKIGMGEFDARLELTGQDELTKMGESLNAMLDNTLSLVQSQDERERIQQSIAKLLEEISGVADGDLTKQAEVSEEVTGAIADSFNLMIEQLRNIISKVQGTTLQVSAAATEVQATAEHLTKGSESQSSQIVDTSAAVEEMAASIQQVSENAALSATVSEQARINASQGNEVVNKTINGMKNIRQQVQETSKRIKRLGESSQEIGEIVQLIGDIADRTSILALNASIQAAMAGEAGRGFAVVAAEVERLAERSAQATKRIGTLIKSIQSETNEAVSAMESTTREVVLGSELANEAGKSLGEIEGVSNRLAELIQAISLASKQQARGSEAIAKSMGSISDITQQTAAGTKQATESIRNLANLAEDLRGSVTKFKLPNSGKGKNNGHRRSA